MSSLKGTNNTLQQWLVRKHGKVKSRASNRKDNYKFKRPKVETRDNWRSRTKGLNVHSNLTCNTTELPISSPCQPGRTGVILPPTMASRVIGTGNNDKRGLGRWAWTRLRGKDRAITIISAY